MTISSKNLLIKGLCLLCLLALVPGCRRKSGTSQPVDMTKTKSGIEMVKIPGGWFNMGSKGASPDESPVHRVWIDSFWMDRFEVIQEHFKKYQLPDPSHFKNPTNPLDQINWIDAALYCNDRSRAEGIEPCYDEETWECNFEANGYRLPTEAEWEYACRAGTGTKFSFGNDVRKLANYAWFTENSSGKTHPVGQKKPNPWGLYDMHGNVAEWCNDFYSENYYTDSATHNPRGPATAKERVLRGGAWNSSADSCRSTYRTSDPSLDDTCLSSDAIGFRCVRGIRPGDILHAPADTSTKDNITQENTSRKVSHTAFVYDDIYLEHKITEGHPETPQRLIAIVDRLKARGLYSELLKLSSRPISSDWLTAIHTPEYVERVKDSCESGAKHLDSTDVPISPNSYTVAMAAVGGVFAAIDAVIDRKVANAFCAIRPPGHHALKDKAMGFCIFNNIAIGTRYVQKQHGLPKVLIVDWDVHHGNGTQDAFYSDPSVLYFGVHQYPLYPGTGSETEMGVGQGVNSNINVPLPVGSGDADYVRVFKEILAPAARAFSPDFVLISAGFDAHEDDPIGGMKITAQGFAELTQIVKAIADECSEGRLVSILEGGYHLDGLARSVEAHIRVLMR